MPVWSCGSCVNQQTTIWYRSYWFWCSDYPQSGQWEPLQAGSCALLTCVPTFVEYLQVLCPARCSSPQPYSGINCLPQGALVPSRGKCPLKTKISVLDIFTGPRPSQWRELSEICRYIHRHAHVYIYTSLSIYTLNKILTKTTSSNPAPQAPSGFLSFHIFNSLLHKWETGFCCPWLMYLPEQCTCV